LSAAVLEHPYDIEGVVEHGDERGRTIGFPTANVAVAAGVVLPPEGVYAGWYERPDGSRYMAAINIGRRPTFYPENGALLVEAFLLDFDGDLYGEHATVHVVQFLRGEARFDSVDDLVAQMHRDVDETRRLLATPEPET
jgi:riboflavin kinase / FMN adenylyltransferase